MTIVNGYQIFNCLRWLSDTVRERSLVWRNCDRFTGVGILVCHVYIICILDLFLITALGRLSDIRPSHFNGVYYCHYFHEIVTVSRTLSRGGAWISIREHREWISRQRRGTYVSRPFIGKLPRRSRGSFPINGREWPRPVIWYPA